MKFLTTFRLLPLLVASACLALPSVSVARDRDRDRDRDRGRDRDRDDDRRDRDRDDDRRYRDRGRYDGDRYRYNGYSRYRGSYRPYYRGYGYGSRYGYGYPYGYGSRYGYGFGPSIGVSLTSRPTYYTGRTVTRSVRSYDDDASSNLGVEVQRALKRRGYYTGGIDGDIGPGSRSAIRNYQADRGLAVTGRIDSSLLRALGVG